MISPIAPTDAPAADAAAPPPTEDAAPQSTPVELAYAGVSRAVTTESDAQVALYADLRRPPVRLAATLRDPLRFREAMSALYAIVGSDYRYVPKDRAAYAAFVRMRRQSAGLPVWQAQQAYFAWLVRNAPSATLPLDPVVTVHPDQVFFEVFSKDEGTYAKLAIDRAALDTEGDVSHGTTNIDFSQTLFDGIQQLRTHRPTRLLLTRERLTLDQPTPTAPFSGDPKGHAPPAKEGPTPQPTTLEKHLSVSDSWLRGFLQVQSAATLPLDTFAVAPIDLYNLLRHLRLHADQKGKRRGIRVELVPGEFPRLVLEPWETVLQLTGEPYRGRASKVVRIWGRRRLMLLRRLLPFVDRVEVSLLGSGLPSFWVFRAGDVTLTLGLTGFTAANWSQAVTFDLLLPRAAPHQSRSLDAVVKHLAKVYFASANEIGAATKLSGPALYETLQSGCQQGRLMFDLAAGVYRLRPLTDAPLDLARLEYRSPRERVARDLLVRRGAVKIVSENRIAAVGLELVGRVVVDEDKREYRPQMVLADEGQVSKAECTCTLFRTQGLKHGPCAHLVALRLCYADQEARRLKGEGGRAAIQVETRTFSRRRNGDEHVVQLSLERHRLKIRRGRAGHPMRLQVLQFNTPDDARNAYFTQADALTTSGYLDATSGP